GDLSEAQKLAARGVDLGGADYDGRTALRLAASEGQSHIVEYLIAKGVNLNPIDRWGGSTLSDARRNNHESELVIEGQDVGANRIDKVLHHTLMLRVRAISFQRPPIREPHDQPVRVAFSTVREVRPAGQIHYACDFALQSAQFRHRAVNRLLTRFLRPPKQND